MSNTIDPNKKNMMANIINLMTIACFDGTVSKEENDLISNIAHSYGLTQEEFQICAETTQENLKEGKTTVEIPEDDDTKAAFLKNLVMGMMCDGNIDENEKIYFKFIAEKFGYDGDKAFDILIDSVANDILKSDDPTNTQESNGPADTHETGNNDNEVDDEALKTEIAQKKTLGKEALEKHDIPAAFDNLLFAAHGDRSANQLFLRIPNNKHWLHLLTEDQVDQLKAYAEKGFYYAQYALGRYYQVVDAEYDKARNLFIQLSKAGQADATAALAIMLRWGQLGVGPIDKEMYIRSLQEACEKGSVLGTFQMLKAEIFGLDGRDARPQEIIDGIKKWLNGNESEDIQEVDPMYYELIALGYEALDDWNTAADYYMKCIRMGRYEVLPDYLMLKSFNHDYELIDEEGYNKGIELGCQYGIPYCFVMRATANKDRYDSTDDENEKARLHELIADDLTTASFGGDGDAAVQLGNHYYYGEYGFEEDNNLAWGHFLDGSIANKAEAWAMLAQIVLDGNGPENLSGSFVTYCRLMALRQGDDDQLIPVILAYRSGALGEYKDEIEKYYQPQYDALSDEAKVSFFGLTFIAVLKPEGKADLIEFDLNTQTWEELEEIIDAKQLQAVHSVALDQLSKELETDGRITMWTDSNKTNPYCILTLVDEDQQPRCFDDIYQLEQIIETLDCKVEQIYYDEFPDDDGRNDPYA